jgi:hypothetical protein
LFEHLPSSACVQNVHSDIHGGLNNWLEARCPLAAFGCGFAFRRLYPGITVPNTFE